EAKHTLKTLNTWILIVIAAIYSSFYRKTVQLPTTEGTGGFSVFLTVFFVLGLIYVVVGAVYNHQVYGAKGLDLLPNIGMNQPGKKYAGPLIMLYSYFNIQCVMFCDPAFLYRFLERFPKSCCRRCPPCLGFCYRSRNQQSRLRLCVENTYRAPNLNLLYCASLHPLKSSKPFLFV